MYREDTLICLFVFLEVVRSSLIISKALTLSKPHVDG